MNNNKQMPADKLTGAMREKLDVEPYDLVPFIEMVESYNRVAIFGAKKYAAWNWSKGLKRTQLVGSLLRHTWAYLRGENLDRESGLSHVDHIMWNAGALAHSEYHGLHTLDDRRKEPPRDYAPLQTKARKEAPRDYAPQPEPRK